MLNVESAIKTHSLKASHPQPSRQTTAAESGQSTFESMLDDNAAKATAAAKDKEQSAATDRTQKGPAPKAKSDKPAADSKPAADEPAPKTETAEKTPETAKAEAPVVVVVEKTGDAETEIPVEATAENAPETESTPTETPATPDMTNAAPVIPVQTLTPADAQPAAPEVAEEAVTQAPVIATVAAQKPVETAELPGKPVETDENGKPVAEKKEQPVKAEQAVEGTNPQAAARPEEQAPAEKGKTPHVALTDAEKEHIARARGEGTQKTDQTSARGKGEQADAGSTVQKATTDVPTQQVQAPATHSMSATATAATPTVVPQAAAQTPVPLSGVGVEIASKATSGAKEFEIRLDPPELGRIEVRLNVDRDGNVTSRLIADRQDTLDLLKRDSSGLERALQDAGLKTSDNGMQFSLRDQSLAQQQNDGNGKSNTTRVVVQDETLPTVDVPVQSYGRLAGRAGGLDIRV